MKSLEHYISETNDLVCKIETAQQFAMLDSGGKMIAFDYACMLHEIVLRLRSEVDEMVEMMTALQHQNQRPINPLQG